MNANVRVGSYLPPDVVYDLEKLARGLPQQKGTARFQRWWIFPYGWWEEADGSFVIFDRKYRPIGRKRPNGSVEIVDPREQIAFTKQGLLYLVDHPDDSPSVRERIFGVVHRLGILSELIRRRELERLQKRQLRLRWTKTWKNRAIACELGL